MEAPSGLWPLAVDRGKADACLVETGKEPSRQVILVGLDGSACSLEALRWAAGYARAVGGLLRPIVAWSSSSSPEYVTKPDFETFARKHLEQGLRILRTEFDDVAIEPMIVKGSASSVLTDASRHADLLVVGTRGLGGISATLVGSVSRQCIRHAVCPVVTIRHQVDPVDRQSTAAGRGRSVAAAGPRHLSGTRT